MAGWLVFARDRYEEPLELHGRLDAGDADSAAAAAPDVLGAGGWIEVQLVPEAAIRWIVGGAAVAAEASDG
jgi:hypothetical protein